jgi:ATP-dependent Clp protease ATP-binding subunit ClpB
MAIRWDKFTIKSQEAIQKANDLAGQNGNPEMLPLHLLAALLQDREGIVVPVLTKLGVNPAGLETQINERISRLPKVSGGAQQSHLSNAMSKVLDQAFKEADKFKD